MRRGDYMGQSFKCIFDGISSSLFWPDQNAHNILWFAFYPKAGDKVDVSVSENFELKVVLTPTYHCPTVIIKYCDFVFKS